MGCSGSTYSSRFPFALVSRISAVQPCDFSSSWVSSNIFVFSHPTAPPPPPLLVHNVLFESSANTKWCVPKQVLTSVTRFVFGSYTASCRPLVLRGNKTAEGWLEPSLQNAGFSLGRILEVNHTRPFSSNIGLWTLAWLCQMASSPQYGEGAAILSSALDGVFGSRTGTLTWLATAPTGSRTGR